ncbi:MerC domain-containing protein [Marinicella rhabdoformis]|uniref:MerC domain-containing protein n=1 Tax=Marinicella rhabdoformis TaxID=2580566 RepID=UPI0012AECFCC|nr:MerC domain-containing protein [Marinicella rhabdoformis]
MRAWTDKLGMFLSGLCAIQCAMLPIILSVSAVVPGWAHFGHGWIWMTVIGSIALWSFATGWKKHKDIKVIVIALVGYAVLLVATALEDQVPILVESGLFVLGGLAMVVAHWRNYRLSGCAVKTVK